MSRDPAWRDEAAARLAATEVSRTPGEGRALIVEDPRNDVVVAAQRAGFEVHRWDRMARPGREAQAWPPDGPFSLIAIRLPKSKPALDLIFEAVLPRLAPEGRILLHGAKDEGIRSATRRIESRTGPWATRATGGHARLLEWVRAQDFHSGHVGDGGGNADGSVGAESSPDHLGDEIEIVLGSQTRPWHVWPGVFGADGIDAGTALLLEHLPESVSPVLDFAAGTGVLGAGMTAAGLAPADLIMSEPDALAARAAALNVPGARVEVVAGWPNVGPLGTVVSNPPYHEGKAESLGVIDGLIRGCASELRRGGEVRMVVQRRLPVEALLREHLTAVSVVADRGAFRVWSARRG